MTRAEGQALKLTIVDLLLPAIVYEMVQRSWEAEFPWSCLLN